MTTKIMEKTPHQEVETEIANTVENAIDASKTSSQKLQKLLVGLGLGTTLVCGANDVLALSSNKSSEANKNASKDVAARRDCCCSCF